MNVIHFSESVSIHIEGKKKGISQIRGIFVDGSIYSIHSPGSLFYPAKAIWQSREKVTEGNAN